MNKPWFNQPKKLVENAHIAIIGGGISGIMLLLHLKSAGYKTTLIEKEKDILSGASGNPVAIIDPYLSTSDTIEKSFYSMAYKYALNFYQELNDKFACELFCSCDLIKIARDEEQMRRFKKIAQDNPDNLLKLSSAGVICSPSGYIIPQKLRDLIASNDDILSDTHVTKLKQFDNGKWSLSDKNDQQILKADAVIISNSYLATNFEQSKYLNLDRVAGQISILSPQYQENNILCSGGYVTPPVNTNMGKANICGATFEKNGTLEISEAAHAENLLKSPFKFENAKILGARRGIRAMSKDHLPLCGAVPDFDKYNTDYTGLHHGPRYKKFPGPTYHQSLFINVGLGARGYLSAPLLAKYLSSLISGNQSPLIDKICHALHPGRFIIRSLSKK